MTGKRKTGLRITGIAGLLLLAFASYFSFQKLHFEESISSVLPAGEENDFMVELLDSADFFDRIVVHIQSLDSTNERVSLLTRAAYDLADSIQLHFMPEFITAIEGRADPSLQLELMESFYSYLPFYLEDADYLRIDTLIEENQFDPLLRKHLMRLNSPAGMFLSRYVFRDPLSLAAGQMRRLEDLRIDENLVVRNNWLLTTDEQHLIFFLTPSDANNTGENHDFLTRLDRLITHIQEKYQGTVKISYIGSLPVAVANARQIKRDIQLTVSIALIVIAFLIYYFFRKKRVLLLVLLPAILGAYVAIVFMGFAVGNLSVISLGIGSVLIGISVDYALHYFTHAKHAGQGQQVKARLAEPVLMSSLTTAAAFLCLLLLSSPGLQQLGMFAAVSVLVAALLSVSLIPRFYFPRNKVEQTVRNTVIEKIAAWEPGRPGVIFILMIAISGFFLFFTGKAGFEKDIEKSNFMPERLRIADAELQAISSVHQKKIYVLSAGNSLNDALNSLAECRPVLSQLRASGEISNFKGIYSLILSREQQEEKIKKWNDFWTPARVDKLRTGLSSAAIRQGFKPDAFNGFFELIETTANPVAPESLLEAFRMLAGEFSIRLSDRTLIATVVTIDNNSEKEALTESFDGYDNVLVFDRKDFFLRIFDTIQKDFDKLIKISLALVFIILLIFFGRIELALITFIPILLSWVWTLGFIGLTGIKLNFFNIIICSLIFGLGVDYSIFITKGLVRNYTYGSRELLSYRSSILISFLTTLTGLGVLILARHPALRSIAALAIVGIVSVIFISFYFQPILFRALTYRKNEPLRYPLTFGRFFFTVLIFGSFGVSGILLSLTLPLFLLVPVKASIRRRWLRVIISRVLHVLINMYPALRVRQEGISRKNFERPSVIVSNHQSMIDILLFLSLSPDILIMTKKWVWNSPLFGLLVRFCGHLNAEHGIEGMLPVAEKRMQEGCSIVVFPEGSRTRDGFIKRYHKGSFYLAQQLKVPVQVFLIHGAWEAFPRNSFLLCPGRIHIIYLQTLELDDHDDRAYYYAAKEACTITRKAHQSYYREKDNPVFYRNRLVGTYIFKGPVLEHYARIKLRLEDNYDYLHRLIPENAFITDIGCGYGLVSMMMVMRSPQRRVTGIDYDCLKTKLAGSAALASEFAMDFACQDARIFDPAESDVFLLSDILHYMTLSEQEALVSRCAEKLKANGMIIIREADAGLKKRHLGTRISELFSTRLGFNKADTRLQFVSRDFIENLALKLHLNFTIIDRTKYNSNLVFILKQLNDGKKI